MTETVKRRLIWLTDTEWDRLNARARREGKNISNLVRSLAGEQTVTLDHFGSPRPAPKPKRRGGTDDRSRTAREAGLG